MKVTSPLETIRRFGNYFLLPVAAAAVLGGSSCRERVPATFIDLEDEKIEAGAGIAAEACYPDDPAEIKHIFRKFLPEYGILPVLVSVRNNDTTTIYIHCGNSLDLRDEFDGFTLLAGGDTLRPVHPSSVLAAVRKSSKPVAYSMIGRNQIVKGSLIPPLGGYYAFKELRTGRFYRPMKERSLYPVMDGGMFGPLVLEPGEERSGYIFFPVDAAASPYSIRDTLELLTPSKKERKEICSLKEFPPQFTLAVRPTLGMEGTDRPAGGVVYKTSGLEGVREEKALAVRGPLDFEQVSFCASCDISGNDEGSGQNRFFSLSAPVGKKSGFVLGFGMTERYFLQRPGEGWQPLTGISAKGARIAGSASCGPMAACAVNFKRKSRIYLVGVEGGKTSIVMDKLLQRNIRRVYMNGEGLFVITSDAVCRFYPYGGTGRERYIKLGGDFHDAAFDGGTIFVLGRGEMQKISASSRSLFERLGKRDLPRARREAAGILHGGRIVMLRRGKGASGDTLAFFDPGGDETAAILPLPGEVMQAAVSGGRVVAALEDGTIVALDGAMSAGAGAPDGSIRISGSAYIPGMKAEAIDLLGDILIIAGSDGRLAVGGLAGSAPRPIRAGQAGAIAVPVRRCSDSPHAGREIPEPSPPKGGVGKKGRRTR